MINRRKDRRKNKRRINWARKQAAWGAIVVDCRGHPGKVVEQSSGYGYGKGYVDMYDDDCDVQSLFDGSISSCSLYHCVPHRPTPDEVKLLLEKLRNEPPPHDNETVAEAMAREEQERDSDGLPMFTLD